MFNETGQITPVTSFIQENIKNLGWISGILGGVIVMYYCGTLHHYPSGLALTDILFFLWTIAVSALFYSAVLMGFLTCGLSWFIVFSKPINYFFSKNVKKGKDPHIKVPSFGSEKWMIISLSLIFHFFIYVKSMNNGYSLITIFGLAIITGLIFILLSPKTRKNNYNHAYLGVNKRSNKSQNKTVRYTLIFSMLITPIFTNAGMVGDIIEFSFEKMGVRKHQVTLFIEQKEYKNIFLLLNSEFSNEKIECNEVCKLNHINILFTGAGKNTLIEMPSKKGFMNISIPTNSIKLILSETKKSRW